MINLGSGDDSKSSENSCGIIMPISDHPAYPAGHWDNVQRYLFRAAREAGLQPSVVWDQPDYEVIHERVVTNIFQMPFAICDLSSKNANVMLELGMRLSFGKPVVLVTDDISTMPFDIGLISALPYRRDFNMPQMEPFLESLKTRLIQVCQSVENDSYKPFIKKFGPVDVGSLGGEDRSVLTAILGRLEAIDSRSSLNPKASSNHSLRVPWPPSTTLYNKGGRAVSGPEQIPAGLKELNYSCERPLSPSEKQQIADINFVYAVYQNPASFIISVILDTTIGGGMIRGIHGSIHNFLERVGAPGSPAGYDKNIDFEAQN